MTIEIDCNIPVPPKRKPRRAARYLIDDELAELGANLVETGHKPNANAAATYLVDSRDVPGISRGQNIRRIGDKIREKLEAKRIVNI